MSLVQVTKEIRIGSKILGALLGIGVLIFLIFQGGIFIQKVFFPKPPTPPEEKFGKIAGVTFPESQTAVPELRVNTISGELPSFSDRINVYPLIKPEGTITALSTTRTAAANAGYTANQTAVNPSVYSWQKETSNNTLQINIIDHNFKITSDYLTNPIYALGQSLTVENAKETANGLLTTLLANTEDIDMEKTTTTNYALSGGTVIPENESAIPQLTRVDFYQKDVDKMKIYYPTYNSSILFFMLTFLEGTPDTVEASYIHNAPDLQNGTTYGIKSSQQAFEDLQNGKGYIVNSSDSTIVDITDVQLGYYLSDAPDQRYLLPIIVFTGKNDFVAYVSAILD